MLDLIIRSANLPDGREGVDIAIQKGSIVKVEPLVSPPQEFAEYEPPGDLECRTAPRQLDLSFP